MRRLYLIAAVFAVACGAPPTGVETELVGSDASLMARQGPKTNHGSRRGPRSDWPDDIVVCAEQDSRAECSKMPSGPVIAL